MMADWPTTTIGDIFDIGAGKTMSSKVRADAEPTRFLRTSNVFWDRIDLSKVDEMPMLPWERDDKSLLPGDLLVCEGGEIGRAAVWEGQAEGISFQNHLHRLRRKSDDIDPGFYAYFLQSAFTQLGIYEGAGNKTTIPNLSRSNLAALDVPKPDYDEQCEIRAVLKQVRAAMDLADDAVRLADELKHAAMRELFTRGLRGEVQNDSEIGLIPESWKLEKAETIFKLTSGKARPHTVYKEQNEEHPHPILGGNGIMGFSSLWNFESDKGLVIGRVGEYCGAVHVSSGKVWITDNALYAKDWRNPNADVGFVAAFLRFFDLNRFKRMAGQPLVTQGMINEHRIPIPSPEEQVEITSVLDAIDAKIDLHKRKKTVLEELFRSLLHKMMTGKIRVSGLDLTALETNQTVAA